jgi:ribose-phosphate pyrophosphokinase
MAYESLMVFTGNANPLLAHAVVRRLNIPLGHATVSKFSDGEVNVEVLENVRGKDCFVLQSTCAPTNDNLMEVLLVIARIGRSSHRGNTVLRLCASGQTPAFRAGLD